MQLQEWTMLTVRHLLTDQLQFLQDTQLIQLQVV